MCPVTVMDMAPSRGPEHASAARRLAGARWEQGRLAGLLAAASGAEDRENAEDSLGEARARVASRQEWLHWLDERSSLAPWADGEWAATGFGSDEAAPREHRDSPGVRDSIACDRDRISAERDRVAAIRDRVADEHDDQIVRGRAPRRVDDPISRWR